MAQWMSGLKSATPTYRVGIRGPHPRTDPDPVVSPPSTSIGDALGWPPSIGRSLEHGSGPHTWEPRLVPSEKGVGGAAGAMIKAQAMGAAGSEAEHRTRKPESHDPRAARLHPAAVDGFLSAVQEVAKLGESDQNAIREIAARSRTLARLGGNLGDGHHAALPVLLRLQAQRDRRYFDLSHARPSARPYAALFVDGAMRNAPDLSAWLTDPQAARQSLYGRHPLNPLDLIQTHLLLSLVTPHDEPWNPLGHGLLTVSRRLAMSASPQLTLDYIKIHAELRPSDAASRWTLLRDLTAERKLSTSEVAIVRKLLEEFAPADWFSTEMNLAAAGHLPVEARDALVARSKGSSVYAPLLAAEGLITAADACDTLESRLQDPKLRPVASGIANDLTQMRARLRFPAHPNHPGGAEKVVDFILRGEDTEAGLVALKDIQDLMRRPTHLRAITFDALIPLLDAVRSAEGQRLAPRLQARVEDLLVELSHSEDLSATQRALVFSACLAKPSTSTKFVAAWRTFVVPQATERLKGEAPAVVDTLLSAILACPDPVVRGAHGELEALARTAGVR